MPTPLVRYRVNASTFADSIGDLGQEEAETRYVKKTGGGMVGNLTVYSPNPNTLMAATKDYVDTKCPPGVIIPWAGAAGTAPPGWLACGTGNQVSRFTYPNLYTVIGTTYGGDGNPNFTLPVIQARVPVGINGGTFTTLGQMHGAPTVGLAASQVPNMSASITMHSQASATVMGSGDGVFAGFQGSGTQYQSHQNPVGGAGSYHSFSWSNQGGGAAHENRQPYIVFQFIIKY